MTDIVIKTGDTPSGLAKTYAGSAAKWPEFCKANPQFKSHPTYGCTFFVGNVAHLPPTWLAPSPSGSPPAPIPGPVPQPVGPAVHTPSSTAELTPAPSLIAGMDSKKVIIGGVVVAGLIVAVYAAKRKKTAAHA
jgi:hypothetical protein